MKNFRLLPQSFSYSHILVEGKDALSFGQRMFSRNLNDLLNDEGVLSLFLSADGKVLSDFWVIRRANGLSLLTLSAHAKDLSALIEHYHFSEDFKVHNPAPISAYWASGSENTAAGTLVNEVFTGDFRNTIFKFDLTTSSQSTETQDSHWAVHRIEQLIPERGKEWDKSTLVFDLGFEKLCDIKGCYSGQEVVERVRSRGRSGPRKLASFEFSSQPNADEILLCNNEPVGRTTSSIQKLNEKFLSLGFIKTQFSEGEIVAQASKTSGKLVTKIV